MSVLHVGHNVLDTAIMVVAAPLIRLVNHDPRSDMDVLPGVRRKVILALIKRVEVSFPQDWDEDFTVQDVVRGWLRNEAQRR